MNRILTYGLATVLATVFTPTVFADKDGHGGGGGGGRGHGGGGGGGNAAPRASAPARVSTAPRVSMSQPKANVMRAPSAPRVATQAQTQFRSAPVARSQATTNFRSQRNSPSVAFGGSVIDNNNREGRRSFATTTTPSTTREFSTRDRRDFRVPFETSRSWDHGRVHEWNNHRYRFSGGSWILIDPGIYDYDYGVTTYASPGFVDSSESLVMSAQDRLNRLGYSAGPADGMLGPQTRDAIADFQSDNGLAVTGGLNNQTVRALGL